MPDLDLHFARAQFPAFSEPSLQGLAFFENAGGSFPCRQVTERLARFYRERKVQTGWTFEPSATGGAEMEEARTRLAAMMGVAADEVHFGPSTSANTYVLAQAVRRWLRGQGGAVVVTEQDHEANSGVWRRLAEDGLEVREWKIDPATGHLDPARLRPLLADGRVRVVAFTHCSNVVAEINPVAEIAAMARAAGAFSVVDGVSYAPHGLPDVGALGCDAYLFSTYKTYGPHQGIMVARAGFVDALPSEGHVFNAGYRVKRLTPAGPDHAQVAACAGMADYADALAAHHGLGGDAAARAAGVHDLMRAAEVERVAPLLDFLATRNDLRLIGPRDPAARAPTVAVDVGPRATAVAEALGREGIGVGAADFYAPRPLAAMGVDLDAGVLRMSLVHYTSAAEVERLTGALERLLA